VISNQTKSNLYLGLFAIWMVVILYATTAILVFVARHPCLIAKVPLAYYPKIINLERVDDCNKLR
jgi:hypothetical protein